MGFRSRKCLVCSETIALHGYASYDGCEGM